MKKKVGKTIGSSKLIISENMNTCVRCFKRNHDFSATVLHLSSPPDHIREAKTLAMADPRKRKALEPRSRVEKFYGRKGISWELTDYKKVWTKMLFEFEIT